MVTLPRVPAERHEIGFDVDVLFGAVPNRRLDASLDAVTQEQESHGIRRGLLCSLRGALFDVGSGNDETRKAAEQHPRFTAVGTVDIRDALGAEDEIARLADSGTKVLRLFPPEQWAEPVSPGLAHIVDTAVAYDLVLLTSGDFSQFWRSFADRGARVCFLDVHAYRVSDFVVMARREPGFVASTRMLVGPDSIERIAGEVGAHHLAYGSKTPMHDVMPSALRLRTAGLTKQEWDQVARGTAAQWLGETQ
ncbi:hypothetical protein OG205_18495 [Lentzea sp. NBC_00516]|uniref:amidohydrolase family protein n=1 Tax=Lentzea sp. NBC_00516 TaxID=2903582 RepID=UPI002E819FFB|nr:hypothetical protein [Lentzea sp. NBC_00516]WUD28912.1 hypothetical protein OG205_18495 [Lentzea sp. NBC_00516]